MNLLREIFDTPQTSVGLSNGETKIEVMVFDIDDPFHERFNISRVRWIAA